jgi:ribonuclease E
LRDLGGLIVIDFIDMKDKKHIKEIEKCFKQAIKRDKARIHCSPISKLGLMEISRQRIKPAVKESSYIKCDSCSGTGMIKSIEASALEVLRKIRVEASKKICSEIRGILSKDVANYLLNNKKKEIVRLEEDYELKIHLKGETDCPKSRYHLEFIKKEGFETDDKTSRNQKIVPWKSKESIESTIPEDESDSLIKDIFNAFHQWRKKKKEV